MYGPRHTYIDLVVKDVPSRIIHRMVDKARGQITRNPFYLEPPFIPLQSLVPDIFAPCVDYTRSKIAFGRWPLPKLRRELHDTDPLIVRQAINSIADLIHDPEKTFEAIKLNIIARIQDLLCSDDAFLRERACQVMITISGQAAGREAIMKNKTAVENLGRLLADCKPAVRFKAALAVQALTEYWVTVDELNGKWFIVILIERLKKEIKFEILTVLLNIIHNLLERGIRNEAINLCLMNVLLEFIDDSNIEISCNALNCMKQLLMHPRGKEIATEMNLLEAMAMKLKDDRVDVLAKVVGCIMFLTIPSSNKITAVKLTIIDRLLTLITWNHRELQINCFKALTNLCEAPEGRRQLLKHTNTIEQIPVCNDPYLIHYKNTLLHVIRWTP